jgi:hypothetical protein
MDRRDVEVDRRGYDQVGHQDPPRSQSEVHGREDVTVGGAEHLRKFLDHGLVAWFAAGGEEETAVEELYPLHGLAEGQELVVGERSCVAEDC